MHRSTPTDWVVQILHRDAKAKEAKATGRPADRKDNVFPLDGRESLHSTTVPVEMTPDEAMQIATLNGRSVRRAPACTLCVCRPSAAAAASLPTSIEHEPLSDVSQQAACRGSPATSAAHRGYGAMPYARRSASRS